MSLLAAFAFRATTKVPSQVPSVRPLLVYPSLPYRVYLMHHPFPAKESIELLLGAAAL